MQTLQPGTLRFSVLPDPARTAASRSQPKSISLGSLPSRTQLLDGPDWWIATDPTNTGREEEWFDAPRPEAKPTKVPWVIQDIFPDYHGVVWYWHDFTTPTNPHPDGRFVLRFLAVDYYAEVWLNGVCIGKHEGSEDPFEFDVSGTLKPGRSQPPCRARVRIRRWRRSTECPCWPRRAARRTSPFYPRRDLQRGRDLGLGGIARHARGPGGRSFRPA